MVVRFPESELLHFYNSTVVCYSLNTSILTNDITQNSTFTEFCSAKVGPSREEPRFGAPCVLLGSGWRAAPPLMLNWASAPGL